MSDRMQQSTVANMSLTPVVVLALCALASGAALPRPKLDGRIVGGRPSTIEEHPYQLSLEYLGYHSCGASIISRYWVLTAAHCVDFVLYPTSLQIRAGSTTEGTGGSMHDVKQFIVHPLYKGNDYDFALIQVKTPFPIGRPGIEVIEMSISEPRPGDTAIISGWGTISAGGVSPEDLRVVEVPVISREICQKSYSKHDKITDRMICAAVEKGGKDACQGDSGGPMVVNGKLAGVVSWGVGCGEAEYPGVYANVANQRGWIRSHTGI